MSVFAVWPKGRLGMTERERLMLHHRVLPGGKL